VSPATDDPQQIVDWRELADVVSRSLAEDLTSRQRSAFIALVVKGMAADFLAEQTGANRNALYKMIFDSRRKIRNRLIIEGVLD
jgi:RNA polymerase sigma-70 factor (ECF subfamily)